MYCIKCGVKLAETEDKCPLCNTIVCHPDIKLDAEKDLYPSGKVPKEKGISKFLCGALIILFLLPIIISFYSDMQYDSKIDWFGFVAGGVIFLYVVIALPLWFKKPNPVIFVPCDFVACILYLFYINFATNGNWFLPFALPVAGAIMIITCATLTLLYYIKRGKLFILGGMFIAIGCFILLVEYLLNVAFSINFIAWSMYPLIVFALLGGLLIYLAINPSAREVIERKLFF